MSQPEPILLLFDGHAIIYRAYHAFPALSAPDGRLINAVYGFTRIVLAALRDFHPEYLAVTFDHPQPTFRHQAFTDYKAHRAEMPDDLKPQIGIVKQVVTALGIPQFELPGFEADDLIGTLSRQAGELGQVMTVIVTGDRDAFQLVDDQTHVWLPARGKDGEAREFDREGVKQKMGVFPEQIVDIKALMGDASDNIPGVAGIGEKTAVKLIQAFGSLDALYQAVTAVTEDKIASLSPTQRQATTELLKGAVLKKLQTGFDQAQLSRQLATIDRQVPIQLDLDQCQITRYNKTETVKIFEELEFKSLVPLLPHDEFESQVQAALF